MACKRDGDVVVSVGVGETPATFVALAGVRAKAISLSAGVVNPTTVQRTIGWREVIAGAGVKRTEIAQSCMFKDAVSDALTRAT